MGGPLYTKNLFLHTQDVRLNTQDVSLHKEKFVLTHKWVYISTEIGVCLQEVDIIFSLTFFDREREAKNGATK